MGGQSFDGPRGNMWLLDPNEVVIIGLDTVDGPEHPLYDERIKLPLDRAMTRNIMANGVLQPITVRKAVDGKPEVVFGRQRVRHAREANKLLASEGKALVRVPATLRRGDERSMFGVFISENELRQGDQVMAKAQKVQRYLDMGHSEDEAAVAFGVTTQSIANWLKLLELSPEVRKAVDAGTIGASAAIALHGLSADKQRAALSKALEGTAAGKKPTAKDVNKARDDGRAVPPSRRLLSRLVDARKSQRHVEAAFINGIQYAMGTLPATRVPGLAAFIREVEAEKAAARKGGAGAKGKRSKA